VEHVSHGVHVHVEEVGGYVHQVHSSAVLSGCTHGKLGAHGAARKAPSDNERIRRGLEIGHNPDIHPVRDTGGFIESSCAQFQQQGGMLMLDTIKVFIREEEGHYRAECLEVDMTATGFSLDETVESIREKVCGFLHGRDMCSLGLAPDPKFFITFEDVPIFTTRAVQG